MNTRRAMVLVLALAMAMALLLPGQTAASPTADPQEPAASTVSESTQPLFVPAGPDGLPGVWLWQPAGERKWLPASALGGEMSATAASEGPPAWPQDPTTLWVVPGPRAGEYWVWNGFNFAGRDGSGPIFWAPYWRLATGPTALGE